MLTLTLLASSVVRPSLPVLVRRYDALMAPMNRVRLGLRAIEQPDDSHRKAAVGRQLRRLRRELAQLIARRRVVLREIVTCGATIPAFVCLQATRGVGPVRAARLLLPTTHDAQRRVPDRWLSRRRGIDAFDEKRQLG